MIIAAAETWQLRFVPPGVGSWAPAAFPGLVLLLEGRQRGRGPWVPREHLPSGVMEHIRGIAFFAQEANTIPTLRKRFDRDDTAYVETDENAEELIVTVRFPTAWRPVVVQGDTDVLHSYADLLKFWGVRPGRAQLTYPRLVEAVKHRTQGRVIICLVGDSLLHPRDNIPARFHVAGFTLQTVAEAAADRIRAANQNKEPELHDVFWLGSTTGTELMNWLMDLSVEAIEVPLEEP